METSRGALPEGGCGIQDTASRPDGTPVLTAMPVPSDLGRCFQGSVSCCDGEHSAASLWGQEVLERVAPGPALGYGLALLSVGETGD